MTMQVLQRSRLIARWVLAWFALVFVVSPVVTPMADPLRFRLQEVCLATGGVALVVTDLDLASGMEAHGLHCPLCLPVMTPPRADPTADPITGSIAVVLCAAVQRIARASSPIPPARGPPALS